MTAPAPPRRFRLPVLVAAALLLAAAPPVNPPAATPPGPPAGATPATVVPAFRQAKHVGVLTVHGPIDGVTLRSLERRVEQAEADGVDALVLDINTPGGDLLSTLDICHLIKTGTPPNTVAWINPQAFSAGTIIALACREIVVSPNATYGDAAPVSPFGPIPQTERAKVETPILAEVVDSARRNHYDENLVQSFVSVGVELWMLEHATTGERIFVTRDEYRTVYGSEPPAQITPIAPPVVPGSVRPRINDLIPRSDQAPEEPMTPEEQAKQIEFEQDRPSIRPVLTEADRDAWRLVMQVVTNDRLLAVKPDEAIHYGLAVKVIAGDQQLMQFFGAQQITRYDRQWSESLVRVLISWPVRIVLIIIFLVALFVELAAPGVGVFGATAAAALLLLIGAPYLAGMAQWWDILLIVAGLALIAAEIFIIPGLGVAGMLGALCLLVGMVGTFISGDIRTTDGQEQLTYGLLATLTGLFAAGVLIWLISRQLGSVPILNKLALNTELSGQHAEPEPGLLGAMGRPARDLEPGDVGMAETDLRPAGRANFEGRILDVKSAGSFIERGTPVRVLTVGKFVIEVEEADS